MPFTPSHALVALPFLRTPLVPAAIAIGAMTPDLPLFLRGTPLTYATTHSWGGLALTVLVALGLLMVWRCLLRPAVRELSPRWLAARLPAEWDMPAGSAARDAVGLLPGSSRGRGYPLLLVASLLLGVVSHIVWDAFTHRGRWGVGLIPGLDGVWGPFTGFRWIQYVSGVVGLAVIGVWALLWLRRRRAVMPGASVLPAFVRWAWWLSLPVTLLSAWGVGLARYGPFSEDFTVAHLAYRVLPPACGLWGAVTLALAVVVQMLRARARRRGSAPVGVGPTSA
ncbi:DUF4184 family protein [Microbacterium jiangjiandongii]|uniref:DUF4184 family protein n=1 Tax=Microbacterium jiangjiandongii TaxID=3049071 RepID=UPI00214BB4BA|nr:DUF4184 family protein [Microbacterium sp. zg.Y843]MCR2816821.1 DUF4184 family protein [Microbacterium sp. zg.Y843]